MVQVASPASDPNGWLEQLRGSGAQFTIKYVGNALVTISIRDVPAADHALLAETCIRTIACNTYPEMYEAVDIPAKYASAIEVQDIEDPGEDVDLNISAKSVLMADGERGLLKNFHIHDISLIVPGRDEFRTYFCFFAKHTERQQAVRRCYCFDAGAEMMEIYQVMGLAFQVSAQQAAAKAAASSSRTVPSGADAEVANYGGSDVSALYGGRDLAQRSSNSRSSPSMCGGPSTSVESGLSTPRSYTNSPSFNPARLNGSSRSPSFVSGSRDSSLTPRAGSRHPSGTEPPTPATPVRSSIVLPPALSTRSLDTGYPSTADNVSSYYDSIDDECSQKRFVEITRNLVHEPWFHGSISRNEAESRVRKDGDFLVRQSKSRDTEGQLVLTAMANNTVKHVMLVDGDGSIHTCDRRFKNIRELVHFYITTSRPLSDVILKNPVTRPELTLAEPSFLRKSPSGSGTQTTHL